MKNYSRVSNINYLQLLQQELAYLQEEDAKADRLRSLPCIAAGLLAGI